MKDYLSPPPNPPPSLHTNQFQVIKHLKLLKEKVGHTLQDIGSGKDLLNRTLFLRKQSNNQQLMNYDASACEGNLGLTRQSTEQGKVPTSFTSRRRLVSRTHKKLKNKASRKQASLKVGYETKLALRRENTNTEEIL